MVILFASLLVVAPVGFLRELRAREDCILEYCFAEKLNLHLFERNIFEGTVTAI